VKIPFLKALYYEIPYCGISFFEISFLQAISREEWFAISLEEIFGSRQQRRCFTLYKKFPKKDPKKVQPVENSNLRLTDLSSVALQAERDVLDE
jgi:hypothetical protein